jgi:DNA-binding response OmpR family regulator
VKQSGASIGVRSTPGKGTTFDIFFPRQAGEAASPLLPATDAEGGNETILVVEDDPSVRAATVRALEVRGYRVLVASGADEALNLANAEPGRVHVLLTDVVMPGRGGPEVARLLIGKRPDMRVLYMSGYGHDAIGHHGVLDAGTNIIGKPFTPDALRARVREVLTTAPSHPKA